MNGDMGDILSLLGGLRDYEDDLVGYVKQTAFEGRFFIEDMNFRLRRSSARRHFTPAKFVEILCLDSIGAVYREYGHTETPIETGVSVNRGGEADGELVFLPNIPIQGIRIVIDEDFYRSLRSDIFPRVFSAPEVSDVTLGTNAHDPELKLVFGQIKRAVGREVAHETYYKNKLSEIIYLLARGEFAENRQKENSKRFSSADIMALDRVKGMIEAQISEPPTMVELARLANASEAKLHSDFKAVYGCTIHDYSQKIRMSEALRKIENGDEPLYSIARGIGYKHPGHFAAVFRNTYGITPSEYVKLKNLEQRTPAEQYRR